MSGDSATTSTTPGASLKDVVVAHKLLSEFYERFSSLMRALSEALGETSFRFRPLGKNPRYYTSANSWVPLDGDSSAWVPSYAVFAWQKADKQAKKLGRRPKSFVGVYLGLDNWERPELVLVVATKAQFNEKAEDWEAQVFRDLTWLVDFEEWGKPLEWTKVPDFKPESKNRYALDLMRVPLESVVSIADVKKGLAEPLAARLRELEG